MAPRIPYSPRAGIKNPVPRMSDREVFWKDIKKNVKAVKPELAKILDKLDSSYPLILKEYDYGATIADPQINPGMSLILSKRCELFFEYSRSNPICRVFQAGQFLCAEQVFSHGRNPLHHMHGLWRLTAGCRNVFMHPRIADHKWHKLMIQRHHVGIDNPMNLDEHWKIFRLIANSKIYPPETAWKAVILSFPAIWFTHLHDPAWQDFYHCIEQDFSRNYVAEGMVRPWLDSIFGEMQQVKRTKLTLAQKEQALNLLMLAFGLTPGLREASEEAMPAKLIQDAYIKDYGLKKYAPIIMAPEYIDWQSAKNLYYSCNHPTSYLISPKNNKAKSVAENMYFMGRALDKIRDYVLRKSKASPEGDLHRILSAYTFELYHDPVKAVKFSNPENIIIDDPDFMSSWPNYELQSRSHFFNGCVRIKKS